MCNVGRCWWWSMVSEVECWWLVVGGYSLMFTFTDSVIATQSLAVIQIYYYTATYDEVLTHPLYSSVFICQDTRVRSAVKASSSTNFKQWPFPRVGSIDSDTPYFQWDNRLFTSFSLVGLKSSDTEAYMGLALGF